MARELYRLAERLGKRLQEAGLLLVTAESCTGGWIAKAVTDVAGSSGWLDRGYLTYSNRAKQEMLGVSADTLDRFGAVSEATVREMVGGALERSGVDLAVAVSGIAGPGGGSPDKPVGTVWLAWARRGGPVVATSRRFIGDREAVRRQTVESALLGLLEVLGAD